MTPPTDLNTNPSGNKLNWIRAAVLGADDGIVSVASIIVGVAAASNSTGFILTAGIAGLSAGALSMAVGEYISVSAQRDTEHALLEKERRELLNEPEAELTELTTLYEEKGLSKATAKKVAEELTAHDPFAAHAEAELHIDPEALANPWSAAFASAVSFLAGGIIPLLAIIFSPSSDRILFTFVAVLAALAITGSLSAQAGGASRRKGVIRVVVGGMLAMAITFAIGKIFGVVGL